MTFFYKNSTIGFAFLLALLLVSVFATRAGYAGPNHIPEKLEIKKIYKRGAGKSVGKVTRVNGKAVILHAEEDYGYQAKSGLSLYNGDRLFTRKNSLLQFSLKDGSRITLSSKTKLVIDKNVYEPQQRFSFLRMLAGKARFIVKKLAEYKKSRFNVQTNSSVIGVRGSDFVLEISQKGDRTVITALDNTVLEVVNPAQPLKEPVIVKSFQQLETELGKAMGQPVDVPWEIIKQKLQEFVYVPEEGEVEDPEKEGTTLESSQRQEPLSPLPENIVSEPEPDYDTPPEPELEPEELPDMPGHP